MRAARETMPVSPVDVKRYNARQSWSQGVHEFIEEFVERRLTSHKIGVPILESHLVGNHFLVEIDVTILAMK